MVTTPRLWGFYERKKGKIRLICPGRFWQRIRNVRVSKENQRGHWVINCTFKYCGSGCSCQYPEIKIPLIKEELLRRLRDSNP